MPEVQEYTKKSYQKFVQDMQGAGRDVEHYRGRFYWEGPAVRVEQEDLQEVIRETTVKVQWDTMGKSGLIVYPRG